MLASVVELYFLWLQNFSLSVEQFERDKMTHDLFPLRCGPTAAVSVLFFISSLMGAAVIAQDVGAQENKHTHCIQKETKACDTSKTVPLKTRTMCLKPDGTGSNVCRDK